MTKYTTPIKSLGRPALAVTSNGTHPVFVVVIAEDKVTQQLDIGTISTAKKTIISDIVIDNIDKIIIDGINHKVLLENAKFFGDKRIYTRFIAEVINEA